MTYLLDVNALLALVHNDHIGVEQLPAWVRKSTQTTDGHLVVLAAAHGAKLASFDTGIPGAELIVR